MGVRAGLASAWAACALLALAGAPAFCAGEARARLSDALYGQLPVPQKGGAPAAVPDVAPEEEQFLPWVDWAEGQRITGMRRIGIRPFLGQLSMGGATPGIIGDLYSAGVHFGLELGYSVAPFLAASLTLCGGVLKGEDNRFLIQGTEWHVSAADLNYGGVILGGRLRLPLLLIGPALGSFSKAREGLGLVPFVDLGIGAMQTGEGPADVQPTSLAIPVERVSLWESSWNFAWRALAGIEVRWSWGGLALDVGMTSLGRLRGSWNSGHFDPGGPLDMVRVCASAGIYF